MTRRKQRELVLQILFQVNVGGARADNALEHALKEKELKPGDEAFVYNHVQRAINRSREIEKILSELSLNWKVSRIGKVERAVLQLALSELLEGDKAVEPAIVINEAVRLAKKYAGDESGRFVNGILGAWFRNQGSREVSGDSIAGADG